MLIHSPDHERLLLVRPRSRPDWWCPPGGRLEAGEDLVEGARREAHEETGLTVEVAGPCYAYLTMHKGERTLAVSMACRASSSADEPRLDPAEALKWGWFAPAEWLRLAEQGRSVWAAADVTRATALARRLLDIVYP